MEPPGSAEDGLEAGPSLAAEPASGKPGCSDSCSGLIKQFEGAAARAKGMEGTDGEPALAGKAAAAGARAWRGCLLRNPEAPDGGCENADRVVTWWIRTAEKAGLVDVEIEARLVQRDPRWRPPGATVDDQRMALLAQQTKTPALALAAVIALRDPAKIAAAVRRVKAQPKLEALDLEALLGAAGYYNDANMPREALMALPKVAGEPGLAQVLLAQRALALWQSGKQPQALSTADELTDTWEALGRPAQEQALGKKEPHPLVGREVVVGALGIAQYLRAENKRATALRSKPPSTAALKNTAELKQYFTGPLIKWVGEKQALVEDAATEYRAILQIEPVPPPRWVVEGALRVGQLWTEFANEIKGLKLPKAVEADRAIVAKLRESLAASAVPLTERGRASFGVCAKLGRRETVAPKATEQCEQALK